jgi:hypothetical protein
MDAEQTAREVVLIEDSVALDRRDLHSHVSREEDRRPRSGRETSGDDFDKCRCRQALRADHEVPKLSTSHGDANAEIHLRRARPIGGVIQPTLVRADPHC